MLKNPQNQMHLEDWTNKRFTDPFFPYQDAVFWADRKFEADSLIASQAYDI